MNPNANESAGLKLPPPVIEQAPHTGNNSESQPQVPEQAPIGAERTGAAQPPALPAIPLPTLPTPAPATDDSAQVQATTTTSQTAAGLDDHDLIEKEWVNKAKQIVESNRDDPYRQSEELTMFKADYLQKHYGKSIKLSK